MNVTPWKTIRARCVRRLVTTAIGGVPMRSLHARAPTAAEIVRTRLDQIRASGTAVESDGIPLARGSDEPVSPSGRFAGRPSRREARNVERPRHA